MEMNWHIRYLVYVIVMEGLGCSNVGSKNRSDTLAGVELLQVANILLGL